MKIVLLSLKGLGDTLMQVPMLRALHAARPEARVTALVPDRACEQVFANCPWVTPVMVSFRRPGPGFAAETLKLLFFLRSEQFDASITAFPSNRAWYNLLARWTGAPLRVTHAYGHAPLRTLAFLQNRRVPSAPPKHELEHNMDLLAGLGLDPAAPRDLAPWLAPEDEAFADEFVRANGLAGGPLVGLHPAIDPRRIYKAWGPGNAKVFAGLADRLAEGRGAKSVVFCGPDEKKPAAAVLANARYRPALCAGATVNQAAALLKRCALFVNTDSGLGHLAAAVGTPAVTVFGPANPAMTAPYGKKNVVVSAGPACAPCYDYPYASTRPRLKCSAAKCMEKIDPAALEAAALKVLENRDTNA
jgi:ADP-heptose:LPS heptosyltransferase